MRRKKKYTDDSSSEGAPEWLTTYSDLVTLLLTFFIMLFSMAAIDQKKFDAVSESLRFAFGNNTGAMFHENIGNNYINMPNLIDNENNNAVDMDEEEYNYEYQKKLTNFKEEVENAIAQHSLEDQIHLIDEQNKIVLRLNEVLLFDTGKADINKNHIEIMNKIGTMLDTLGTEIIVEGHTDNVPINTYAFPSNWELSTKRAVNIVKYFIDYCDMSEKNLIPQGRGEFQPIADNATEEGRRKNRRIDIIVDKYISIE